ncbi:MAG: Ribose import ATP-binding protein RbsA [Candidatus Heimdallarchaeota archaeon LC_2]|nr:MAG: Ribose import ATP-binding protein RbsA [Candidatus Heimdallarchaeota archaeon LC_2]
MTQQKKKGLPTIFELVNVTKSFPGVLALDNVSLRIKKGEILAILGENGAGKSTLMKIISGLYQPTSGEIRINEEWFRDTSSESRNLVTTKILNPREGMKLGTGMVYQHFQLVEPFTVVENITLGKEFTYNFPISSRGGNKFSSILMNNKLAIKEIKELSEKFGLPLNPNSIVEDLSVGLKQRVEILKQLYRDAELLILDEPTAVLTPSEVVELFKTMNALKKTGKSIIFISHKLKEPLAIADRIVVMRKGAMVGEILPKDATEEVLAEMVVGRKVLQKLDRESFKSKNIVLDVQNLSVYDPISESLAVNNISFKIHKHQIVGIAGVQGNGQTELANALVGLRKTESGSIFFNKQDGVVLDLINKSTLDTLNSGVAYIPEDRTTQGLILDFQITENTWLGFHNAYKVNENSGKMKEETSSFIKWLENTKARLLLPIKKMDKLANSIVDQFEVMTVSIYSRVKNLSGGNQQKVLLGREFAKQPELIIASQPTRGVDIGVMEKVHQELINRRADGAGILLISSDLDEVLKLSDYILVLFDGKIAGHGNIDELTLPQISQLMTTGREVEEIKKEVTT